jgi:6-phosphogluconolactonase
MSPEMIVDKPQDLPEMLARRFEGEAHAAVVARGRFALALSGGSVATTFFPRLARCSVDWARTDFFWGDERAVPPDDPESNFGAARRLWLEPARVPLPRIHRMEAEAPDLEGTAAAYADVLTRVAGTPPRLDLALLGVGPDGHVCSLFPGHPLLEERGRFVAPVLDSPKPPPRRLTLTLPALAAAEWIVVAALGAGKAAIVREALEEPGSSLPVALVAGGGRGCLCVLDDGAASLLGTVQGSR